ncbi:MAG: hypothetical protein ACE5EX_04555, partial [Phycisphaerae bacterium]
MIAKTSYLAAGLMLTALWGASAAHGQCTGVTISGAVYSGTGTVTYTLNALGEPVVHRNVALAPAATPLTPAVDNARVMIQNMEDGAVVGYGTFADPTLNAWSACVPAGQLYIAMYSATGHDLTSRVFDLRGDVFVQGTQVAMVTDAYLPALHMNLTTGVVDPANPVQALGNILVYAFEENQVNGAPDWPIDPGLPGVYMELYDPITGAVVASGTTAVGGPGAPTIATKDGLVFGGGEVAGLLYLQDIPPGEYRLRATPGTTDAAGLSWTGGWYHTYTMEGTQEWEILIYPGDPGTEAGAFMAWFGFVKKLGQLPAGTGGSSISGVVEDADVPFEAVPPAAQCVWPTNWDPNICEPPEAGAPLDPTFINQGVSTNGPLANAFLVLWKGAGPNSQVLATAETNAIGEFSFANIPAGNYNIFFVDIALNNIFGEMRLAVDGVNPLVLPTVANEVPGIPLAIVPRFGARVNGFVMDGNNVGIAGATVNLRYQAGNAAFSTVTDATGWYNFDFLPEIETMAMIDVEPPAGYRGKLVTDTYWPAAGVPADPNCTGWDNCPIVPAPCDPTVDAGCIVCGYDVNNTPIPCSTANGTVIQRNGKNRWVQYYTANYKSNLILEPIPAGVGQIHGLVFNDS